MDSDLTKAQHYRDQAVRMRGLADAEDNEQARKGLIELSEVYDRLCQNALRRASRKSP